MRQALSNAALAFGRVRQVAIADCVHFCAYRYGRGETNPYEQYAMGLAGELPLSVVRERFVEYLRGYRPRHLGEALGVVLSQTYPLWYLPWRRPEQVGEIRGWSGCAGSVVDVMTHFSDEGIPRSVVEQEFGWHESAFAAIARGGYRPRRYSYIVARELRGHRSAYLLTDGNHRLSAMSALGVKTVELKLPLCTTVNRTEVAKWPLVRAGLMTRGDALAVFDAYLSGNIAPVRSEMPARVIAPEAKS